jgi:hypothetical protein
MVLFLLHSCVKVDPFVDIEFIETDEQELLEKILCFEQASERL